MKWVLFLLISFVSKSCGKRLALFPNKKALHLMYNEEEVCNMKKFVEKLGWLSQKLGNQIHLKSMRDAFATILPFIMLAGFMVLINNVIIKPDGFMSNVISSETLTTWQELGNSIVNGTLGIITILIGASVSYFFSTKPEIRKSFCASFANDCIDYHFYSAGDGGDSDWCNESCRGCGHYSNGTDRLGGDVRGDCDGAFVYRTVYLFFEEREVENQDFW